MSHEEDIHGWLWVIDASVVREAACPAAHRQVGVFERLLERTVILGNRGLDVKPLMLGRKIVPQNVRQPMRARMPLTLEDERRGGSC